jgi:hypothetical protein
VIDAPIVWAHQDDAASTPAVLQEWAEARGLRLVAPREGGRHAIPVDARVATRVEKDLHAAHELLTQHDADGAERALARAEEILREHPELPQAPWLLAEVQRGWAARFARLEPVDPARAARAWRAAAALDGGRMAGLGEPSTAPAASVPFSIELLGAAPGVELRLDAEVVTPGPLRAAAGLHALVARAGGDVVFAEWIAVAPRSVVRVAVPTPEPCSTADLAGPAPACPSWVAARAGDRAGTFRVRVCGTDGCGPELDVAPVPAAPKHHVVVRHGLPAWAAWTLAGAGVVLGAVAAGAVVWAVLPTTTRVVFQPSPPH